EIERKEDIRDLFVPRFYFGCEADDPMVAWAFDTRINPMGARLRAMFSSDMGHWDVPEMSGILEEAWKLVEKGQVNEENFRDFVLTNPVRFYTSVNRDFFVGTRVEETAARILAGGE
ncbi:MAG: amidohydrolase, partial [Myxococcota bacterium]|nr:amidohydrolase [Myxococcota bacterium]